MNAYGITRYQRNVYARYPGGAAKIIEWTPKNTPIIDEEITDENGLPIEETIAGEIEEATAVLGCPVGFVEPIVGELVTITKSAGVTKSYICISKERPERAGQYMKMSITLRAKNTVDYTTAVSSPDVPPVIP